VFWLGGGWGQILDGSRCLKKKSFSTWKRGHYCTLLCNTPSQPPTIAYNIAQYIFLTTPFIAIKYWQYLVRAKLTAPCLLACVRLARHYHYP